MQKPITKEQIEKEPAGPRIDALFAELVMGWKEYPDERGWWLTNDKKQQLKLKFNPSTNISHAMEGLNKHIDEIRVFDMVYLPFVKRWMIRTRFNNNFADDEKLELAITRALLMWAVEGK